MSGDEPRGAGPPTDAAGDRTRRRGGWRVLPNPKVGAVIARGAEVLAEGFHAFFGGPHAEVGALRALRERGLDPQGTTLYVTLEPCTFQGKTPPCVDAVIAARFARVVIGQRDPNPQVDGGHRGPSARGVEVVVGAAEAEVRRLNGPFNKQMKSNLPYVTAKWP